MLTELDIRRLSFLKELGVLSYDFKLKQGEVYYIGDDTSISYNKDHSVSSLPPLVFKVEFVSVFGFDKINFDYQSSFEVLKIYYPLINYDVVQPAFLTDGLVLDNQGKEN